MNCQEFWDQMPELGGEVDDQHLRECAACAARMERQGELQAGLRTMAESDRRAGAPARVESRLRAAFRGEMGVDAGRPVRSGWRLVLPWAAAAAAVVVLAVVMVRARQPETTATPSPRGTDMAMAVSAGDVASDYEGFIPLPNAGKLADTEDVNLVRVEVPRSAMIALGLEVSPERASEMVEADVMIGPDGLARAVRFLDADTL